MHNLFAKCRKFRLLIDLQLELFDTMVLPMITYGCEIWGYRVYVWAGDMQSYKVPHSLLPVDKLPS